MKRRELLTAVAAVGVTGFAPLAAAGKPAGLADVAGTPLQFVPQTPPDPNPLENELAKYPKCPYCGMDRTKYHHTRHLVHYSDDRADGTCSLHCAAISLALNIDRSPKAIYAPDFAVEAAVKPLVDVDAVTYLVGSKLKGTMSARSKIAFASRGAAEAAKAAEGGELADFDGALTATYLDMAKDTVMIRKRRAERRKRMESR